MRRPRRKPPRVRRLLVLTVLTAVGVYSTGRSRFRWEKADRRSVEIKPGQSSRAVAAMLEREGVDSQRPGLPRAFRM